jgi:hypothetical protein
MSGHISFIFPFSKDNAFARADELGALRNRCATDGGNGPFASIRVCLLSAALRT